MIFFMIEAPTQRQERIFIQAAKLAGKKLPVCAVKTGRLPVSANQNAD